MLDCADNTPEQRARLWRSIRVSADEHFFAELLTNYTLAIELGNEGRARFYLDEVMKKYSEAVRR